MDPRITYCKDVGKIGEFIMHARQTGNLKRSVCDTIACGDFPEVAADLAALNNAAYDVPIRDTKSEQRV